MFKKSTTWILLSLCLLLLLALPACSQPQQTTQPPATENPEAEGTTEGNSDGTVSFTDSAGRTVDIPQNITKIAPSGQLSQMFLIAIAPDLLCTIASPYAEADSHFISAEMLALPVIGQFYGSADLSLEEVASIGPDIVIDIGEPKNTIVEDMDSITTALSIPAIHVTATLDSAPEAFRTLGTVLGREAKGEELALYCEKALAAMDTVMASVPVRTSVLYCTGDAGLNVLAQTSFHAELLDRVTDNLAVVDSPAARGTGNEVDLEQLLNWNPEVIIFSPASYYDRAGADPTWQELQAISSGKYYEVPQGPYNWMGSPPSINRYLGIYWLLDLLYPEQTDFDLAGLVTEYYQLFYDYDLPASEFAELTANSTGK